MAPMVLIIWPMQTLNLSRKRLPQWCALAACGCVFLSTPSAWSQTADDYIVDQFGDDTTLSSWSRAWGITPTFEWDPEANSTESPNPAGALKVTVAFDLVTLQGENQTAFQRPFADLIDFEQYKAVHFDIKVDESSSRLSVSWGTGQFGGIDLIARTGDWSTQLNNITTSDPWLGVDDYGVWRRFSLPVDQTLANHHNMAVMMFHIWSGWSEEGGTKGGHTGPVTFWIDNFYLEKKTDTTPPPPPTLSLEPATSGLQLIASQAGSQYQRQSIRTVADDKSWVGAAGPVSYELTIKDAPAVDGFQTHMFLIPNSTGDNAPDWNRPDAVFIGIYSQADGGGNAEFGYKRDQPSGNSQIYNENRLATLDSAQIRGTWKVTFNTATDITLSAPDGSSTNFTMAADAAAAFANPLTVYFGAQPNNLDFIGQGVVLSNVKVTGVATPINDSFTSPDLNPEVWAKAADNAAGVFVAGADARYWLTWTLPAVGFSPQTGASITGAPWQELNLAASFKSGTNQTLLVNAPDLPAGPNAFFRMIQRPFKKLQILLPGETAAPGTASGKTGTPDVQGIGVPFNVIVNAVDDNWYLAGTARDVVNFTSTDASAVLPADTALVGGTLTLPVTLNDFGTFTLTVTDVTDGTKTGATSAPVQTN